MDYRQGRGIHLLTMGQRAIRAFLKVRTSYDVLPLSFRLIVFDQALLVNKSLNILLQNGEQNGDYSLRPELTIQPKALCLRRYGIRKRQPSLACSLHQTTST